MAVANSYRAVSICKAERTRKSGKRVWKDSKRGTRNGAQRLKDLSDGRKRISGVNCGFVLKKVLPLGPECQLALNNCLCPRQSHVAFFDNEFLNSSFNLNLY